MKLSDTVDMMNSSDYKERLKAEYFQSVIRYNALKDMLEKWSIGKLESAPKCPISLCKMQLEFMANYCAALEARAAIEGIDLGKRYI